MLPSQLNEVRRLSSWADENLKVFRQRGLSTTQIAQYFLSTSRTDVPLLSLETVDRYLVSCCSVVDSKPSNHT